MLDAFSRWRKTAHRSCACDCDYCGHHDTWGMDTILHDLLCPWEGDVPPAKCSLSECHDCGEKLLKFCPRCEVDCNDVITYKRFDDVQRGSLVIHELVEHTTRVKDFVSLLRSSLQAYTRHHFVARWQCQQRQLLMDGMDEKDRIVHVDFAANLVHQCYFEVQLQEFSKFQSSILVFMVGQRVDGKFTFTTHYVCSNDRQHDFFFLTKALDSLIPQLDPASVQCFHFFSDGPANQFRNKFLMNYISKFEQKFQGAACKWNFFATCHGRGIWDAEGGLLKQKVQELNRQVSQCGEMRIADAKDLVRWANQTDEGKRWCGVDGRLRGGVVIRRHVYLLTNVRRSERRAIEGIPGLRSVYCVASKGQPGEIDYVFLSCYCDHCIKSDYDKCEADDTLGEWQPHVF